MTDLTQVNALLEGAPSTHITVFMELWQIVAAVIVYTGGIIGVLAWLNTRFSELLHVEEYSKRHEELKEDLARVRTRLESLELWRARFDGRDLEWRGRGDWGEVSPGGGD